MIIEMIGRASGPYGELNRRQRLDSSEIPIAYLQHLADIGVARVIEAPQLSSKSEVKKKEKVLRSSASQPAQASLESKPKRRRGRPRKSSASTMPGDSAPKQSTSTPATNDGGDTIGNQ